MSLRTSRMYPGPVPKMPPGLIELMEGLAKDVLKNSPVNIYEFCAQHMQKLIEIRDGKDSTSDEKISRDREKVRRWAEKQQEKYDSEMVMFKTNEDGTTRNKRGINEICRSPTNGLSFTDNLEKEVTKIEQNHNDLQIENEKVELNIQTITGNNNSELDLSKLTLPENVSNDTINESMNMTLDESSSDVLQFKEEDTNADIEEEHKSERASQIASTDDIESVATSTKENINNTPEYDIKNDVDTQPQCVPKEFNGSIDVKFDEEIKPDNSEQNSDLNDISKIIIGDYSNNTKVDINSDEIKFNQLLNVDTVIIEGTENDNSQEMPQSGDHNYSLSPKETSEIEDYSKEKSSSVYTETQNGFDDSMDLEKAAITIQKVFRAFLFKSKTLSVDDVTNVDFNFFIENADKEGANDTTVDNLNKEKRSLGISKMDTVLQTVNEEKSLSLSTEDSSTLSSAATIIQAHVRGFLVRSKMPFNQTISTASINDCDIQSASVDGGRNQHNNKTILNIHIVSDGSNFISRDESIMTSVDLSLDGSPHYSTNLHPLGYDKSERRKQLKREDAVQSISPPSNNSAKLSEDIDSVKEILHNDGNDETKLVQPEKIYDFKGYDDASVYKNIEIETHVENVSNKLQEMTETTSDEADVVTPLMSDGMNAANSQNNTSKLMHSGEFHDIVLPTMISRNNTSVVRGE